MTKYKLKSDFRNSSQVTLVSYMANDTNNSAGEINDNNTNSVHSNSNSINGDYNMNFNNNSDNHHHHHNGGFDNHGLVMNLDDRTAYHHSNDNIDSRLGFSNNYNKFNGHNVNLTNDKLPYHNCDRKDSNNVILKIPDQKSVRRRKSVTTSNDVAVTSWLRERTQRTCTKKLLYKRLPIFAWLPKYNTHYAISDLVAGFTVGLTVIPQAIAYANVAGLPPQYGLYSSFMACFVYTVFGSCKDSPVGPTAILAILTRENLHGLGPDFAVLLCFLSGCIELLMGILQLGFLIDFISGPVSVGFTSAAAIVIATSQVKDILGLKFTGGKFLEVWELVFEHIGETRLWDTVLGIVCMIILLLLRKAKDISFGPTDSKEKTNMQKLLSQFFWFISTARNILVVIICAVMAFIFDEHEMRPFILTGPVKSGLPTIQPPPFSTTVNNHTYNFFEMTSNLSSAILVVPLLSILENIALAKVFAEGKAVDATQEMISIGLCNIVSSFVSSMPVSGALSRGAVNNASGVKTTLGGIYTGIIVIISLKYFTPYFYYIPKASLAAVIIAAVVFMVEFHVVKPIWRSKKVDLIPAVATFLSCLFIRLELGIVIGIAINVLFLLYASARPSVRAEKMVSPSGYEYLRITPDRSLRFPSVEYVRKSITKAGVRLVSSNTPVVIDARHVQGADFTAAEGIKSLIEDFMKRNQALLFYNVKPNIVAVFQGVQPTDFRVCNTEVELNEMLKGCSVKPKQQDVIR